MKSDKILTLLRQNKEDKAFGALYHYLPKVEKLIQSNSGTKEDARDVFQEALIVFCRKAKKSSFVLTASIDTYLYSTCRFLWNNELRKRKLEISDTKIDLPENLDLEGQEEELSRLQNAEKALGQLGQKCIELLQFFYHQAMSMKEIAEKLNFSSEKSARNQKYKCLEQAKKHYRTNTTSTL